MEIKIELLSNLDQTYRKEVSQLFVDAYYKDLKIITKDAEKLSKGFEHAFNSEVFFVALNKGKVIGMLACANHERRALTLKKKEFMKHFGFFKGGIIHHMMKKTFHGPLDYSDRTTYIECVATGEQARGKGVATQLMNHVYGNLDYTDYVLEVSDTNERAFNLYKRLGYQEFKRIKAKHPKQMGFNESIYMKRKKGYA